MSGKRETPVRKPETQYPDSRLILRLFTSYESISQIEPEGELPSDGLDVLGLRFDLDQLHGPFWDLGLKHAK
jgi:hypothetical protein